MTTAAPTIKLPRRLEADPRLPAIQAVLTRELRLLWAGGTVYAPHVPLTTGLEQELRRALHFRHLERGLEHIEQVLGNEKRGLSAQLAKQGATAARRVSRLLLVANDGAERFYRACESLMLAHTDRLLCVVVESPSGELAQNLFGEDRSIKALLISDKEAVTETLLALI